MLLGREDPLRVGESKETQVNFLTHWSQSLNMDRANEMINHTMK